jgi:RNA polymerase sigma factor (sigma-70 family)
MDRYAFVLDHLRAGNFKRLRRFEPRGSARFTTWLVLVARRLCLDHRRRHYGRRLRSDGRAQADSRAMRRRLADLVGEQVDVAGLTDDASDGPEARLAADERGRAIELALAGLDPRARLLLTLRFRRGLTAREIGELMGYPSQFHVFRHLKAVLATVRQALIRVGVEGPGM